MKKETIRQLARCIIALLFMVVAGLGMMEMHFSVDFFPVYDGAGQWHAFPQIVRYGMYALLGLDVALASYVIYEAEKSPEGVLQRIVALLVIVVAGMGIMEMHFSVDFFPVYDGAGQWHAFPQIARYGLYALLATNATLAFYVVCKSGEYVSRRIKRWMRYYL